VFEAVRIGRRRDFRQPVVPCDFPMFSVAAGAYNAARVGWLCSTGRCAAACHVVRVPRVAPLFQPDWDSERCRFRHLRE